MNNKGDVMNNEKRGEVAGLCVSDVCRAMFCTAPVPPVAQALTFDDALRIAKGCTDYGGGYRGNDEHFEIFQHGIQTVINSLEGAAKKGLADMQVRCLHAMGAKDDQPAPADLTDEQIMEMFGDICTNGEWPRTATQRNLIAFARSLIGRSQS